MESSRSLYRYLKARSQHGLALYISAVLIWASMVLRVLVYRIGAVFSRSRLKGSRPAT